MRISIFGIFQENNLKFLLVIRRFTCNLYLNKHWSLSLYIYMHKDKLAINICKQRKNQCLKQLKAKKQFFNLQNAQNAAKNLSDSWNTTRKKWVCYFVGFVILPKKIGFVIFIFMAFLHSQLFLFIVCIYMIIARLHGQIFCSMRH